MDTRQVTSEVLLESSTAFYKQGKYDLAIRDATQGLNTQSARGNRRLIENRDEKAEIHLLLCKSYFKQGKYEDAIKHWLESYRINHVSGELYYIGAKIMLASGAYQSFLYAKPKPGKFYTTILHVISELLSGLKEKKLAAILAHNSALRRERLFQALIDRNTIIGLLFYSRRIFGAVSVGHGNLKKLATALEKEISESKEEIVLDDTIIAALKLNKELQEDLKKHSKLFPNLFNKLSKFFSEEKSYPEEEVKLEKAVLKLKLSENAALIKDLQNRSPKPISVIRAAEQYALARRADFESLLPEQKDTRASYEAEAEQDEREKRAFIEAVRNRPSDRFTGMELKTRIREGFKPESNIVGGAALTELKARRKIRIGIFERTFGNHFVEWQPNRRFIQNHDLDPWETTALDKKLDKAIFDSVKISTRCR